MITIAPASAMPHPTFNTVHPNASHKQHIATFNPNRLSLPNTSILWQQHQQQLYPHRQQQHPTYIPSLSPSSSTSSSTSCSPSQSPPPPDHQNQNTTTYQRPSNEKLLTTSGRPRLSLDTSRERLEKVTVIRQGDKSYLKLFSPVLVESPVSFLDVKQQMEDTKLWENGADAAFATQLETERREANKVRSRQQIRGLILGLWLGFLFGLLMLQHASSVALNHLQRQDSPVPYSPLVVFLALLSTVAIARSGTRCMMTAVGTCTAVLTCFATVVVHQIRVLPEFRLSDSMVVLGV